MSDCQQAAVLLSGGLDSTAALCWARRTYRDVVAVSFDYGQPNRDHELTAAHRACLALGIDRIGIVVADTLPRGGILRGVADHDGREDGQSPDFVPGRNAVFAVSAAAHASVYFRNGTFAIVLGCNAQDARRFPDCHPQAMGRLGEVLRHCLAREVWVVTPWIDRTKAQVLRAAHQDDRPLLARSWSCYRREGPCGRCGACVLRVGAFEAVGIEDESAPARMTGGDVSRCL